MLWSGLCVWLLIVDPRHHLPRFSFGEIMTAHAHSSNQDAGSKQDNKNRSDVTGIPSTIGHPFIPHVQNAPVRGLTTRHTRVSCPECFAGILWNGDTSVTFPCQGCGSVVDGANLSG